VLNINKFVSSLLFIILVIMNNYITYLSGGLSGIVEICFIHPIEYYKTILQSNNGKNRLPFLNFIKSIYINNGFTGLYKGFLPRLYGIIPMRTVFWGTLTTSEKELHKTTIDKCYIPTIAGATAGIFQTIIDCPIESMKTKLMTNNILQYNCINFNGFVPNLYRNVFFAIIFNTNKQLIETNYDKKIYTDIIIGSFCGSIASIITQPFDYIKTQQQLDKNIKIRNIISKTKILTYWTGGLPRTIITCMSMSIGLPIFNLINNDLFCNDIIN